MQGTGGPSRGVKFLGSYTHQIDEKGRVSLPASFRREAADQRFVLVQPYPPALALYPELEWGQVEERLTELMGCGSHSSWNIDGANRNWAGKMRFSCARRHYASRKCCRVPCRRQRSSMVSPAAAMMSVSIRNCGMKPNR